jgi:SAM-dependent methyltransferase
LHHKVFNSHKRPTQDPTFCAQLTQINPTDHQQPGGSKSKPPLKLRVLGQSLSLVIAVFPRLWPFLRRFTHRFWERSALTWDERIRPDSPEHLTALSAPCDQLDDDFAHILEIGTGTGAGAAWLGRRFPRASIEAIDLSESMVEAARKKVGPELATRVRFSAADAASLPFDAESFDLVVSVNVPIYFSQTRRVLSHGGTVIVANSLGSLTPYYTPRRLLERGFKHVGIREVAHGHAGAGSFWIGRRP